MAASTRKRYYLNRKQFACHSNALPYAEVALPTIQSRTRRKSATPTHCNKVFLPHYDPSASMVWINPYGGMRNKPE